MIHFEVDQPQNLLLVRYSGLVRPEETESGLDHLETGLAQLQSGLRILVDLTGLESMDAGCAPFIERAMDLCNEKGPSLVVRVIPDPHRDIGLQIMSIFHYGHDVRILTLQTLAEAMQLLAGQ